MKKMKTKGLMFLIEENPAPFTGLSEVGVFLNPDWGLKFMELLVQVG